MKASTISTAAESAREQARQGTGEFGTQPHAESGVVAVELAPGIPADAHMAYPARTPAQVDHEPALVTFGRCLHLGGGVWAHRSPFTGQLFLAGGPSNGEYDRHLAKHGMPSGGLLGSPEAAKLAAFTARIEAEVETNEIVADGTEPHRRHTLIWKASEDELVHCEDLLLLRRNLGRDVGATPHEIPEFSNNILKRRFAMTHDRVAAGGQMNIYSPDSEEVSA